MHELPITKRIIEIAEAHAAAQKSEAVTRISLVVGARSGIVVDSILLYFDLIAKGTKCENAEICVEYVKPMLKCKACGRLFERKPFCFVCTFDGCNGEGEPTEIGTEFIVKSIETRKTPASAEAPSFVKEGRERGNYYE